MRMLPGQKPRPLIRELRRVVADPKVQITPIVSGDATVTETLDAFDKRAAPGPHLHRHRPVPHARAGRPAPVAEASS